MPMMSDTVGLKCAPEIGQRARLTFPPANLSAMIPEPTTVATRRAVPRASAAKEGCIGTEPLTTAMWPHSPVSP
jgi:hypothetical protein